MAAILVSSQMEKPAIYNRTNMYKLLKVLFWISGSYLMLHRIYLTKLKEQKKLRTKAIQIRGKHITETF